MKNSNCSFLLYAKNLTKSYQGVSVVDELSLSVKAGECFALLGPNGAGKTTTCEMLEGLLEPDQGEIEVCGKTYEKSKKEILELIGVQLQETQLYKKYTVTETLSLFASFYKKPLPTLGLLELLNLSSFKNKRLEHLSGGQRQAVYLACALINRPKLLFLDEPTAGLDPRARRMIWDIIASVKDEERGIFLTTHYLEEAEKLADRIAIMDRGKVLAEGSPEELVKTYCPGEFLRFTIDASSDEESLSKGQRLSKLLPWLSEAKHVKKSWELSLPEVSSHIPELSKIASEQGVALSSFLIRQSTLEDVFLKITGRNFDESV